MIIEDKIILALNKAIDPERDNPELVSFISAATLLIISREENKKAYKELKNNGGEVNELIREINKDELQQAKDIYNKITEGILKNHE